MEPNLQLGGKHLTHRYYYYYYAIEQHAINKMLQLHHKTYLSHKNMTSTPLLLLLLAVLGACECFIGIAAPLAFKRSTISCLVQPIQLKTLRQESSATDAAPHAAKRMACLFAATLLQEDDATYLKSFQTIDSCAAAGSPSDDLHDAVRYIDRNASKLYPNESAKEEMWKRAYGSWKLQLATGPPSRGGTTPFKSVPIFAFAMIDENNFGNGVGLNQDRIILSLLGNHYFNVKKRVMGIGIDDMFLFSNKVTQYVPGFISDGMGLKKKPEDFSGKKGSRMPAFTIIGSSEKSLIARGGSGGIAIWTRLEKDIRPAAYGRKTQ